jgi:hypothetical protein
MPVEGPILLLSECRIGLADNAFVMALSGLPDVRHESGRRGGDGTDLDGGTGSRNASARAFVQA